MFASESVERSLILRQEGRVLTAASLATTQDKSVKDSPSGR